MTEGHEIILPPCMHQYGYYQKNKNNGEDVEKLEHLCTSGGKVKWCSPLWETVWWLFKKLKIKLPYDPAI